MILGSSPKMRAKGGIEARPRRSHNLKRPQAITDTELAVLKLLWERGSLTAREISQGVYSSGTTSDIGTVHSMLQRLESKQMIERDRSGHVHVFSAAVEQSEVAGMQLEQMAEKLSDGSMTPFLTHLVDSKRLTDDELQTLHDLLKKHSPKKKKR